MLALVGLALTGAVASLAMAYAIASFIAGVFDGDSLEIEFVPTFLVAASIKVAQTWLQEFLAVRASSLAKEQLRSEVVAATWRNSTVSSAEIGVLAGRGLDALDPYFAKFIPQLIYTIIVTPLMVLIFLFTDLLSGITLAITLPLVPLFMALIGWATAELQSRQMSSLTKLGSHFGEVVKALGTLKLFGRTRAQEKILSDVSSELRTRTMKVLRVSFLSGFTLELAASLSVALIAVSIGMRLVNSELNFDVALFLLILAPEAFLPLRAVGANFHASSEGVAAAKTTLDFLDQVESQSGHKSEPMVFKPGLTLIEGSSGSGKSTIFTELLGLSADQGRFNWLSEDPTVRRGLVAWMPQQPKLSNATVIENIIGESGLSDLLLDHALDFANATELRDASSRNLSGGEAARVNLARAIYRLRQGNLKILLLDEPTASVDRESAKYIRNRLRTLANGDVSVIVISHEIEFRDIADELVTFV